jgi:hypothetical protein
MKVTVTDNSSKEITYLQVVPDAKRLHKALELLSNQQAGSDILVLLENNGHKFPFSLTAFDIEPLVRVINGIITKTTTAKPAAV